MGPDVQTWVAIDDVDFNWADSTRAQGTPLVKCRSVQTHAVKCLTEHDAELAIDLLLNPRILTPTQEAAAERRAARKTAAAVASAKAADHDRRLGITRE